MGAGLWPDLEKGHCHAVPSCCEIPPRGTESCCTHLQFHTKCGISKTHEMWNFEMGNVKWKCEMASTGVLNDLHGVMSMGGVAEAYLWQPPTDCSIFVGTTSDESDALKVAECVLACRRCVTPDAVKTCCTQDTPCEIERPALAGLRGDRYLQSCSRSGHQPCSA